MRFFNCVFICIFMAMLVLPLVFIDLSSDRVSTQENRKLAERPRLTEIKTQPETFVRQFDAWFKDSTGFREQLLALYNAMGMSTKSGDRYGSGEYFFLVGEHEHHFWIGKDGYLLRRFQGEPILSDEQLAYMANKLEEIKTYLDKRGIPFIVMFCVFKEEIYPEFYPKSVKRGPGPTPLDIMTNYIKEHTNADVFNIKQALLAEKYNYMLYPVSSGDLPHYTEIGAFFAYRELIKHINKYFPDIVPYELNDINISYDKEERPIVSLKIKTTYKKLDPSFFDDVELTRPFLEENRAYENKGADLPVILFFRDSYAHEYFLGKYIAQQFGKAIFIHYMNIKHFEEYVDKYKPDLIVFEAVTIRGFFDSSVAELPELSSTRNGHFEVTE